uniref:heme-binding domain-containing protein n=1 Tax=Sulfurovum sp. TaxID=1969726 RepID=UPI0035646806
MKYKILGIVIIVVISIQFIPYGKNHSNPSVVAEPMWDSPKTKELFVRACADCHSNETKWPWYSN